MKPFVRRWLIGVSLGIMISCGVFFGNRYLHRNDKYARVAKVVGVDVNEWAEINRVYDRAAKEHDLSDYEFSEIETWLKDKNQEVSIRALVAMRPCEGEKSHARAIALTRQCLADASPNLRRKAITGLAILKDPQLKADVSGFLQDQDDSIRFAASDALGLKPHGR